MLNLDIHQTASFYYLKEIKKYYEKNRSQFNKLPPYDKLVAILDQIESSLSHLENPASNVDYSSLYFQLQKAADKVAKYELNHPNIRKDAIALDPFFLIMFENDNHINQKIYGAINPKNELLTPVEINQNIKNTIPIARKIHPYHPDNKIVAFLGMIGFRYHPLRENIPYVNFISNQVNALSKNLRFGNQTHGKSKVNAAFKRYLLANARRAQTTTNPFQYVYINLMKSPQSRQDHKKGMMDRFVRFSEGLRGGALEKLNGEKDLKVAVITLPADNKFLLKKFKMKTGKESDPHHKTSFLELFENLAQSIQQNKNDFYMTSDVKDKLFGPNFDNQSLEEVFNGPLGNKFRVAIKEITGITIPNIINVKDLKKLNEMNIAVSPQIRSAILFHLIKFNLTDSIISTLKPTCYNVSCKEAIDRGAIHNLWHHMNARFKQGNPISQQEFLLLLDSPAILVKHRALNHNRNLLWNVLNHRMKASPEFAAAHPFVKEWLRQNNLSQSLERNEGLIIKARRHIKAYFSKETEVHKESTHKTKPIK